MVSKSDKYYILMGDVVDSRSLDPIALSKSLKKLVKSVNENYASETLSPYTITLGDEFQGVTKSLKSGVKTLFYFEENRLIEKLDFKLHYVLNYGLIHTKINPNSSYGMLGKGLSDARELLSKKKRDRKRFKIEIDSDTLSEQLNALFEVMDAIIQRWKKEDFSLILDMINNQSDKEVGDKYEKDRSQIYKRRNTLMIREYNLLKQTIISLVKEEVT